LTKLIIDAYDSLGASAEAMEALRDRHDLIGRWSAVCQAVRSWAIANPNEYALIYGSPVPGYVAPPDTIAPASRVSNLLAQILAEAVAQKPTETGAATGKEPAPRVDGDRRPPGRPAPTARSQPAPAVGQPPGAAQVSAGGEPDRRELHRKPWRRAGG
jgi:hypothetical protein